MSSEPPKSSPWLIVVAASAGGVEALRTILGALPVSLSASVVVVLHRTRDGYLDNVLRRVTPWPVQVVSQGDPIRTGIVYVARSDTHLTVTPDRAFIYRHGSRIQFLRAAANPLFESAGGRSVVT